jgi:serine/threonine-protein kinase
MLVSGPLSEKEIVKLGSQLADGLAAAHEHGVIHRDLKPANIRVTPDARLKILDFGLAMILHREASPTAVTESVSETKALAGTLPYMAPEQLLGSKLDARTDIWATGCVLYEMATGRRPFLGTGPALIDAILHQSPPAISKLNPKISAALDAVIQKCLDKDPGKRYQSAREIAVDLQRAVAAPMSSGVRLQLRGWFAARHWTVTMAVAVLMLIACILIVRRMDWQVIRRVSGSADPAAYETYLQGLEFLRRYDKPGNLDAAIRSFETTTKTDPKFALAFAALGEAYWDKYRQDEDPQWVQLASASCQRAAELNDRLPAVFVTLGRIHDGTGQHNLALQEFERALELDHRDADALLGLGDAYSSTGRIQEAENTFKRAAAMRPEYWEGYHRLGVFYYQQRRYAEAASQFRRVVELLPDHASAHASLGTALMSLGQEPEAEVEFKKSLALAPDYAALANLGVMYYRQKRFAESATMTEQALQLNDKDYRLWNNLAIAYEWLGQPEKAKNAFSRELARLEQIVVLKSQDAVVRANLGVMYAQQGQRKRALPHLEAALALSPDNPEILNKVGEAYEKLGERSKGLKYFEEALRKGFRLEDMELNPDLHSLLSDASAHRMLEAALAPTTKPQPSANR